MRAEIRKFLHDTIAELLGLELNKVVWANQDGVRQKNPLVTLMMYSFQGEAMEDRVRTSAEGEMDIKTPTAFVLEVRYFGEKKSYPTDILDGLVRDLEKPTVVDKCFNNGVAVLYADPVQDITSTLENNQQYEPAAVVDLHCRFTGAVVDDVGVIESVDGLDGEGKAESHLMYGKISKDGEISSLERAIPVDISVEGVSE